MATTWTADALTKGTSTTSTIDTGIIKILATDFISNDDSTTQSVRVEDDTSNFGIRVANANSELFVWVDVPSGYTATKVKINGSDTANEVEVYTLNLDNGTLSDEISNTGLNVNEDLDLDTYHVGKNNNALAIMANTFDTGDKIYGGYVTIQRS